MLKAIVHFTYPKPMKTKESNPEVPENQRSEPKRYKHRASRSKTQSPMASQNKHVLDEHSARVASQNSGHVLVYFNQLFLLQIETNFGSFILLPAPI